MQNITFGPVNEKIAFIKALRSAIPGLGLVEAKRMMDAGRVEVPDGANLFAVMAAIYPFAPNLQSPILVRDQFDLEVKVFQDILFQVGTKMLRQVNNFLRKHT